MATIKRQTDAQLKIQAPASIDKFIADFYCRPVKLVIEVDGGIHKSRDQREYDINREAELNNWGIKVIRFTNDEIEYNINFVKSEIERTCLELNKETNSQI